MQNPEYRHNQEASQSEYYIQAKSELERIFEAEEDGVIRVEKIIERLSPILKDSLFHEQSGIDSNSLILSLQQCKNANTSEEFVNSALEALRPYITYQEQHPTELQAHRLRILREEKGYVEINEMIYYNVLRDEMQIHINDVKELGLGEKISLLKDGMEKLALVMKSQPQIKGIFAASWIIAKNPGLVERLGFTITGPLEDGLPDGVIIDDDRPISGAYISREELLKRYH